MRRLLRRALLSPREGQGLHLLRRALLSPREGQGLRLLRRALPRIAMLVDILGPSSTTSYQPQDEMDCSWLEVATWTRSNW